jgi:hypothetical protein
MCLAYQINHSQMKTLVSSSCLSNYIISASQARALKHCTWHKKSAISSLSRARTHLANRLHSSSECLCELSALHKEYPFIRSHVPMVPDITC